MTPLDQLFDGSISAECRHNLADGTSVHWYQIGAQPGDPCLCGQRRMTAPAEETS